MVFLWNMSKQVEPQHAESWRVSSQRAQADQIDGNKHGWYDVNFGYQLKSNNFKTSGQVNLSINAVLNISWAHEKVNIIPAKIHPQTQISTSIQRAQLVYGTIVSRSDCSVWVWYADDPGRRINLWLCKPTSRQVDSVRHCAVITSLRSLTMKLLFVFS